MQVLTDLTSRLDCRLLFATHYHSLTRSFDKNPRVALRHMACLLRDAARTRDSDQPAHASSDDVTADISFLYSLAEGACPKSYGLRVASMAGIPPCVVKAASSAAARLQGDHTQTSHGVKTLTERPPDAWFHSFLRVILAARNGGMQSSVDVLKDLRYALSR